MTTVQLEDNKTSPNTQGEELRGAVSDWFHSVSITCCTLLIQLNQEICTAHLLQDRHSARHCGYKFIYDIVLAFKELTVYLVAFTSVLSSSRGRAVIFISGSQGQVQSIAVFGTLSWPPTPSLLDFTLEFNRYFHMRTHTSIHLCRSRL